MPKLKGKALVLYVNTGTDAAPTFTKVGAQRGFSKEETSDTFETTSKDSNVNREYEYSYNSGTISLNGLYIPEDEGLAALKVAQRTHKKIIAQQWENGVAVEEADCLVTSRAIEGPHDDTSTYTVQLQVSGDWREAPVV